MTITNKPGLTCEVLDNGDAVRLTIEGHSVEMTMEEFKNVAFSLEAWEQENAQ